MSHQAANAIRSSTILEPAAIAYSAPRATRVRAAVGARRAERSEGLDAAEHGATITGRRRLIAADSGAYFLRQDSPSGTPNKMLTISVQVRARFVGSISNRWRSESGLCGSGWHASRLPSVPSALPRP